MRNSTKVILFYILLVPGLYVVCKLIELIQPKMDEVGLSSWPYCLIGGVIIYAVGWQKGEKAGWKACQDYRNELENQKKNYPLS